jgi:hypothetical protein
MTMRLLLCALLFAGLLANPAGAVSEGATLAKKIADRPVNESRVGKMRFELTSASGAVRRREALMLHSQEPGASRIAIHFETPAAIQNTAFLAHDNSASPDESWLYLPATERVRRIPASDRGDYFMGTDITYGDIIDNFRFALKDWTFSAGGQRSHAGALLPVLKGEARSAALAKEMGYGSFEAIVDPETLFPVLVVYADPDGTPLKRVEVLEQQRVGGAWTAMRLRIDQLQTGHRTLVQFENMRALQSLPLGAFDPAALGAGPPAFK